MEKIRVASLFSGIGGFETGLFNAFGRERTEVVFSSEIDKFASKAYEAIYGEKPNGDIRQVNEKDVPDHEMLVGGFPCQAFSIAGKKKGLQDTRGTLFFEIARIAKEKSPKVMILENVVGLLSNAEGETFKTIIRILSDMGYSVDFDIINSKYFDVPQSRDRVIFACVKNGPVEKWETKSKSPKVNKIKKTLNEEGLNTFNFDFPEQTEVSKRIYDILEKEVDQKYFMKEEITRNLLTLVKEQFDDTYETMWPEIRKFMDIPREILNDNERQRRVYNPNGVAPAVLARPDTAKIITVGEIDINAVRQIRSVYDIEGVTPTIDTAQGGHRQIKVMLKPDFTIRKLTPLECFRLQGLPDEYHDLLRELKFSNAQLYKMAGNAVTTNVIQKVAERLLPYIEEK